MIVQPTSVMAKAVVAARNLILSSTVFKERCKLDEDCPHPAEHLFLYETRKRNVNVAAQRPCCVIGLNNMDWSQILPGCARVNLISNGAVIVILTDHARKRDFEESNPRFDAEDSYIDFLNFFGGVMDEMDGRLGDHAYDGNIGFQFNSIELLDVPDRTPYQDRTGDDFWAGVAAFHWGRDE